MKTVLFLINGFGIEHKNSYSVYDKTLMPNFSKLMDENMFSSLDANINDYRDGYRNFSLDVKEMYNYSLFNNANKNGFVKNNKVFLVLRDTFLKRNGKLHLFCFVDKSESIVEQLRVSLRELNPDKNKTIFLHIVLTSTNIEDYRDILKILSKINVDLNDYAKIGLVMGLNTFLNTNPITELNFFFRILISEITEKWQSFSQKLDVCYGIKQSPCAIKPFVVNNGFTLSQDDIFLFWNYERIDLTSFLDIASNIKYGSVNNNFKFYSLFSIVSHQNVSYMLNYEVATNSLWSNLKGLSSSAMILAKSKEIPIINYYCHGLQSINSDYISYIEFDNYLFKPRELLGIINTYDKDLFIINYDILEANDITELKTLLHNIDIMIGNVYENSKGSKYSLIISSLYGINKVMKNDKGEICNIIYNGRVPLIYIDDFITKKNYLIEDGSINDLARICYKNINKDYMGHSIIVKKNALYRLLFK